MTIAFDSLIVSEDLDKSSLSRVVGTEAHLKQVHERRGGEVEEKRVNIFQQTSVVKYSREQ